MLKLRIPVNADAPISGKFYVRLCSKWWLRNYGQASLVMKSSSDRILNPVVFFLLFETGSYGGQAGLDCLS